MTWGLGKRCWRGGKVRGTFADEAVVVTVTVTLVAELPTVAGFGEAVQVDSEGAPAQVKVTAWLKSPFTAHT